MTTSANNTMVQIVRAGTTLSVGLDQFLPNDVRTAIAPANPDSVAICYNAPEQEFDSPAMCIYDRSKTIDPFFLDDSFSLVTDGDIMAFRELHAPKGRIYAPILYYGFGVITDELFYDGMVEVEREQRGAGIAKSFYINLEAVIRQLGFRYQGGLHTSTDSASFFIRGGRRFAEELIDTTQTDELRRLTDDNSCICSIKYFDPEDERAQVRPELQTITLDQRLELLHRVYVVKSLFETINSVPPRYVGTICEIMDDMQERGIEIDGNFLSLDTDKPETIEVLKEQAKRLWNQVYRTTVLYTRDEIEEFSEWLQ